MHSLLNTESVFLHKKTTDRVAATLFFNMSYLLFQYHAICDGSQTLSPLKKTSKQFQYHAICDGSQTIDLTKTHDVMFQYHAICDGSQTEDSLI